jgi:PAS domain S-box-containing protein
VVVDPLDIVARSADAAFATDERGRIVLWNRAAERLLGHPAANVLGKPCHEILCGRDVFGNRFCDEQCSLTGMARRHEPVRHFEMEVRRGSGEKIWASFSIVVAPGPRPSQRTIIHLLQPVDRRKEVDELVRRILAGSPAPTPPSPLSGPRPPAPPISLTPREFEVLRLVADGTSTREIADSLFISVTTTRNHIQNILRKLEVHSKLEAVALALRNHLL